MVPSMSWHELDGACSCLDCKAIWEQGQPMTCTCPPVEVTEQVDVVEVVSLEPIFPADATDEERVKVRLLMSPEGLATALALEIVRADQDQSNWGKARIAEVKNKLARSLFEVLYQRRNEQRLSAIEDKLNSLDEG